MRIKSLQYNFVLLTILNCQKRLNWSFFLGINWQQASSINSLLESSNLSYMEIILEIKWKASPFNKTASSSQTFNPVISGDSFWGSSDSKYLHYNHVLTNLNLQTRPNCRFFLEIKWQIVSLIKQPHYLESSNKAYLVILFKDQVTACLFSTIFFTLSWTSHIWIFLLDIKSLQYNDVHHNILNFQTHHIWRHFLGIKWKARLFSTTVCSISWTLKPMISEYFFWDQVFL